MNRALSAVAISALVLSLPRGASAENSSPDRARFLMPGEIQSALFTASPAVTERWYRTKLVAGRSYAVYAWAPGVDPALQDPDIDEVAFFTDEALTPALTVYTDDQEVHVSFTGFRQAQTKIIPDQSGVHWIRISTSSTPVVDYGVDVLLVETTLFVSQWFRSQAVGFEPFFTIRNNTDASVTVVVTAHAFDGVVTGNPLTVSIPGNGNAAVAVGSGLGAPEGAGSAQIAHTGPPGAITASEVQANGQLLLGDAMSFEPRMRWSLLGRSP